MELVKQLVPILLTCSIGLVVAASGIASSRGDFVYVLRRPGLLARAFFAIVVIPVIAALAIVGIFPVSPASKAGILLMAISPVPPLVPGKALRFGGESAYVYGLQTAAAVMALVTVPLLGSCIAALYDSAATFPIAVVARNIAVGLVVPLAIGLAIGRWLFPNVSPQVPRVVSAVGMALLLVAVGLIFMGSWPQIEALIGDGTALAMALVVVAALLGGHFLGGPSLADRSTLAFAAAMRHPGIALALAGANQADTSVSAAVLLFLLVGMIVLVPYQIALRRHQRQAADLQA